MEGKSKEEAAAGEPTVDAYGSEERVESAMEGTPGAPTWPIPPDEEHSATPPVGLNWHAVSQALEIDHRVLEHDGSIVLTGEYFPGPGYAVDPRTFRGRYVGQGDIALKPYYFLGETTLAQFNIQLPLEPADGSVAHPVMRSQVGPLTGLFGSRLDAERARSRILRGGLGGGISLEDGPLGVELRVKRSDLWGRVATTIASHGGAIISIGGRNI